MSALASCAHALKCDAGSGRLMDEFIALAKDAALPVIAEKSELDQLETQASCIASVGQALLARGSLDESIQVLECAASFCAPGSALLGSVYSALGTAFWKSDKFGQALGFMHQALLVAETCSSEKDVCRAHGNLGGAYYDLREYKKALHHYGTQLEIATRLNEDSIVASGLSSLGQIYAVLGDLQNALVCHKKCALIYKRLNDIVKEGREVRNIACVYAMKGDFHHAVQCQQRCVQLAQTSKVDKEVGRALVFLAYLQLCSGRSLAAAETYQQVVKIACKTGDAVLELKALLGLSRASASEGEVTVAEKVLRRALVKVQRLNDQIWQARIYYELGTFYHRSNKYPEALENYKKFLSVSLQIDDKEGCFKAYGNIGLVYHSLESYEQAVKYQNLALEVAAYAHDRSSEAVVHGNMAASLFALGRKEKAVEELRTQLKLASESSNLGLRVWAETSLGMYFVESSQFSDAVKHLEASRLLLQVLGKSVELSNVCLELGYVYYKLQKYLKSIEFYEMHMNMASESERSMNVASYCHIGLAYLAVQDFEKAVRCQKLYLAWARENKDSSCICKALSSLGEIYVKMGNLPESKQFFEEGISVAKKQGIPSVLADMYHAAGSVLSKAGRVGEALHYFQEEVVICYDMNDMRRLCKSLEQIGYCHEHFCRRSEALSCYQEIVKIGQTVDSSSTCIYAYKLMGRLYICSQEYKEAVECYEKVLKLMQKTVDQNGIEIARIHGCIGRCFVLLRDYGAALTHLMKYQRTSSAVNSAMDLSEAYRLVGKLYQISAKMPQAQEAFERGLAVSRELGDSFLSSAYGDLADLHWSQCKYKDAISCFAQELDYACRSQIKLSQIQASLCLGQLYCMQHQFSQSQESIRAAYSNALQNGLFEYEALACLALGDLCLALKDYSQAIENYDKALMIAEQYSFNCLLVHTLTSLAKTYHLLGDSAQCSSSLKVAVTLADLLSDSVDQIRSIYRVCVAFYVEEQYDTVCQLLLRVVTINEQCQSARARLLLSQAEDFIHGSYALLQRALVKEHRYVEALYFCQKANLYYLDSAQFGKSYENFIDFPTFAKFESSLKLICRSVCCYSVVFGDLYAWLITAGQGVVKFWCHQLVDGCADSEIAALSVDVPALRFQKESHVVIESYVKAFHDNLTAPSSPSRLQDCKMESCCKPLQANCLSEPNWHLHVPCDVLYDILVAPIDSVQQSSSELSMEVNQITFIAPWDLAFLPFGMLKGKSYDMFLLERFAVSQSVSLFVVPDRTSGELKSPQEDSSRQTICLMIEDENARADALSRACKMTLCDVSAEEKTGVLKLVARAGVCHVAANTPWEDLCLLHAQEPSSDPPGTQFSGGSPILHVNEILGLSLDESIISFGTGPSESVDKFARAKSLPTLASSILVAGASCALSSLWPCASQAELTFLSNFYEMADAGMSPVEAFRESVRCMIHSVEFSHPFFWAGFVLYVHCLPTSKIYEPLTSSLHRFLRSPDRASIKVILHLVEKARQRLAQARVGALYAAESSISEKIGKNVIGWKDLMSALGFRFQRAQDGLPDAVFFPGRDSRPILDRGSSTLYALLGLSESGLSGASLLCNSPEVASHLVQLFQQVGRCYDDEIDYHQHQLPVHVWEDAGSSKLLASLGFEKVGQSGKDIFIKPGKAKMRRPVQCAMRALADLLEIDLADQPNSLITKVSQSESNVQNSLAAGSSARQFLKVGEHGNKDSLDTLVSMGVGLFGCARDSRQSLSAKEFVNKHHSRSMLTVKLTGCSFSLGPRAFDWAEDFGFAPPSGHDDQRELSGRSPIRLYVECISHKPNFYKSSPDFLFSTDFAIGPGAVTREMSSAYRHQSKTDYLSSRVEVFADRSFGDEIGRFADRSFDEAANSDKSSVACVADNISGSCTLSNTVDKESTTKRKSWFWRRKKKKAPKTDNMKCTEGSTPVSLKAATSCAQRERASGRRDVVAELPRTASTPNLYSVEACSATSNFGSLSVLATEC